MIKQLTVFLANEQGRLSSVCRALADARINVHALVLADTAEYVLQRFLDGLRVFDFQDIEGVVGAGGNAVEVLDVHAGAVEGIERLYQPAGAIGYIDAQDIDGAGAVSASLQLE